MNLHEDIGKDEKRIGWLIPGLIKLSTDEVRAMTFYDIFRMRKGRGGLSIKTRKDETRD